MEKQNTQEPKQKEEEQQTSEGQSSNPENKQSKEQVDETTQNNNSDDKVTISKNELEKMKKKASDFDGLVEKQRLAKLEQKKQQNDDLGQGVSQEVFDEIKSLKEELNSQREQTRKAALNEAYKDFIKEHPWANDDQIFSQISENFNVGQSADKVTALKNLKKAALNTYPGKYEASLKEQAKKQTFAESNKINTGGNAGAANNFKEYVGDGDNTELTADELKLFNRVNFNRKKNGQQPMTKGEFKNNK